MATLAVMDDAAAITAVLEGDVEAFAHLVQAYRARLAGAVAACCRDAAENDEVVQEAFVHAFCGLAACDPRRPFYPWLKTIALNALRNRVAREATGRHHAADLLHHERARRLAEDTTLDDSEREHRALQQCLQGLDGDSCRLLRRKYGEGITLAELAGELRTGIDALKMRLLRLRQRLRTCIQARLDQGAA